MIVDASVVIDAVADPGPRGVAAREALASQPAAEPLIASVVKLVTGTIRA